MWPALILSMASFLSPQPHSPQAIQKEAKVWETRLGSLSFKDRAKASRELEKRNWISLPLLEELRKSKDPEVTYRATLVRDKIAGDTLSSFEPYPQIDTLWYDWKIGAYNGDLSAYQKYQSYLYRFEVRTLEHYYYASQLLFADLLHSGVPEWQLRAMWIYMHIVGHHLNDSKSWPWSESERIKSAMKAYIWGNKQNACEQKSK